MHIASAEKQRRCVDKIFAQHAHQAETILRIAYRAHWKCSNGAVWPSLWVTLGPAATEARRYARPTSIEVQLISQERIQMSEDKYYDIAHKQLKNILRLYRMNEHENPIMLYDLQEDRIYAYHYDGFKNEFESKNSRIALERQYRKALANNEVVVFVRDNEERKLVSYSFGRDSVLA
ncbi:hypothetical protein G3480_16240 [Thiorhodococcus mannitoliphagus]|uniref:Uncharacterized protein n=1 Tax=Thiorhodococcus mannitoliphagus TaxID=329406 RepID=A0A6P1DUS6_9GAMM|nr:hypothetical protein [Thiorhodococcus mannitoliphagus]NEX21838.1 hypothetical protein [Thiorhodococcus mannitoliphagus]